MLARVLPVALAVLAAAFAAAPASAEDCGAGHVMQMRSPSPNPRNSWTPIDVRVIDVPGRCALETHAIRVDGVLMDSVASETGEGWTLYHPPTVKFTVGEPHVVEATVREACCGPAGDLGTIGRETTFRFVFVVT